MALKSFAKMLDAAFGPLPEGITVRRVYECETPGCGVWTHYPHPEKVDGKIVCELCARAIRLRAERQGEVESTAHAGTDTGQKGQ